MADPVLPIVGFVFGVVGFLATVRNGASTILNDVDQFKQHGWNLVPLLCEIELYTGQLEIWRCFWKIHERIPAQLLEEYWGVFGARRLEALLASIDATARNVREEFSRRYGHVRYAPSGRSEYATISEERRQRRLDRYVKRYKKEYPLLARLDTSLFRSPLFRRHLDALKASISELQEAAIVEYRQEWLCDTHQIPDHVNQTGTQFLLTHLAKMSAGRSQSLLKIVADADALIIDLRVDQGYGVPVTNRSQVWATRAGGGLFPYHFQIKCLATDPFTTLDTTVEMASGGAQNDSLPSIEEAVSLSLTISPNADMSEGIINFGSSTGFISFNLHGVTRTTQTSEVLRTILLKSRSCDLLESLHGDFSLIDRIKLAYELAETSLILLKTQWFQGLCSCAIRTAMIKAAEEDDEDTTEFRLRMTHIEHLDPDTGELETWRQFCEEDLAGMHIRRLGILFIEIALGQPVIDAGYDSIRQRVEIDLADSTAPDGTRAYTPRETAEKIRKAAGEDFSMAVEYCLRQGTKPEDISQPQLERFYNKVVAP
ncbi:hypothetical protein MMC11_007295 [Xylographa trunciseda]|nr:hypothetical protein [Xylographa trunciseda]